MTLRRGYSDSKLSQWLKPKEDEDIDEHHFLPKFLVKETVGRDDFKTKKSDLNLSEEEKFDSIFDLNEAESMTNYFDFMNIKEVNYI
jgi:hypothetical protein